MGDYVECPECGDSGPFLDRSDGDLQCSECGEVFAPEVTAQ